MNWIVAGLGNPGKKYDFSRHNTGFCVLDVLSHRWSVPIKKMKFQAQYAEHNGTLLLKPQTFMNLSGQALRDAAAYYKIPPERVLVIFDDTSLPLGQLRLRAKGSDGGHNGIKDIIYHLNSDSFPRVKLGIGQKPHPEMVLADWVLSDFSKSEQEVMSRSFTLAAEAVEYILQNGIEEAMNKYNGCT